jgi:hypothetical protein
MRFSHGLENKETVSTKWRQSPHQGSIRLADVARKTPGKKKPKRLMDAWGLKMHKPW